ncbi:MAG: helix-turn-helix domain-containing protein [Halanaerobiales bacterium]
MYFVVLTPNKRYAPICHACKSKAEGIHSWHQRKIRDLDILGNKCYVVLHYRKIYCPNCGTKVEKTGVTSPGGPQVTNRLAQYIHELCQHMTVKEVAEPLNLDWETVKKIHQKFLKKEFGETDYFHSGLLAIDEVSCGKYHLIASYNRDVIDKLRGAKQCNKSKDKPEYKIYKGSRGLLFKNEENLKDKEVDKLKNY